MARPNGLIQVLRRAALRRDGEGLTDADLLEAFVVRREEAAFEALLRRHGPMVWGVCRRVLQNEADAEDAFQATFLVLVRKAASVRPRALVGHWLYGVAHNTALKAKAMSSKRRARERQAADRPRPEAISDDRRQAQAVLDEELSRLPEKYRVPVVLCHLQGRSRKEAARDLGVPEGTVAGRLARARALLADRLARRGVALSAGALALVLSEEAAAGVPAPLLVSTAKAAALIAAGGAAAAETVSAPVAALTEGVIRAMFLTKVKVVTALLLLATALLCGATSLLIPDTRAQGHAADPADRPGQAAPPEKAADDKKDAAAEAERKALDELKKIYALADGEDLKCVRPPFPEARLAWFRAANVRRVMVKGTDDPPTAMSFRWNKGDLQHTSGSWGEQGLLLRSWIPVLTDVSAQEIEGKDELLQKAITADFVVRQGAPAEKVVASLEKALRKEFNLPVKLAFQEVHRNVYVASGEFRLTPVAGRAKDHVEIYAKDLTDPKLHGGGSGDLAALLKQTGTFITRRIVAGDIKDAPKGRLSWHYNLPDANNGFTQAEWDAAHDVEGVLKHFAEQTGLTFKEESRKVRVLAVERKD
jgi:RNA polymerase sigma factor (sigma-70 family)